MIIEALKKAKEGQTLTERETYETFREIMSGEVQSEAVSAAFLTAVQMNGPTVEELTGAARAMREASLRVPAPEDAVDIVGTGGDDLGTFNCSTTAAFIAAGAGVTIAKHGNRASTSKSGSADCLAALGYDLNAPIERVGKMIAEAGIGFCFANACHPAMRYAALVRKALPFPTIFNLLGPLTNPAGVKRQALGVYSSEVMSLYVGTLKALGTRRALVFSGPDGMDELGLAGPSHVADVREDGSVLSYDFDPKKVFGRYFPVSSIAGGTPEVNAALTLSVLQGVEKGPYRLTAALNAAAALVAGGKVESLEAGLLLAAESIDSGRALAKLKAILA